MADNHSGLTVRETRFVEEYLARGNGAAAAKAAGFDKKNARSYASRLLRKPAVAAAIAQAQADRSGRLKIDADRVLQEAWTLYQRCIGELKPLTDRRGRPVKDDDGNPVYVFNAAVAARCLEIMGRHVSVNAFAPDTLKVEHSLADRLIAGRNRDRVPPRVIDVEPETEPTDDDRAHRRSEPRALPAPQSEPSPEPEPTTAWRLPKKRGRKPGSFSTNGARVVVKPSSRKRQPK